MKTIKKSRFITITSLFMGFASLISFCFGSWTFIQDKNVNAFQVSNAKPVAYISGGDADENVKYTTIEKALKTAVSGQTVYVIPNTNYVINGNIEIKSGVTLMLPYSDKNTVNSLENTITSSNFSDASDESKLTTSITLKGTLTNYGTLEIGGELGGGGNLGLFVAGNYSQILMSGSAKIENHKTINCYGYIKEEKSNGSLATIENFSGSNVYMPMCIYDWNGGSYAFACNKADVLPINIFDFPNVKPQITYDYGSVLEVALRLYVQDKWRDIGTNSRTKIIGKAEDKDSFFLLSSGSSLTLDYQEINEKTTTNDAKINTQPSRLNITKVNVKGKINLGSLTMSISVAGQNASIETSKVHCPLSYKFDIVVDSGANLTFNQKVKFEAGAKMLIEQGAEVTFEQSCVFYQENQSLKKTEFNQYPSSLSKSTLINNGILNINSSFGGYIQTEVEGAKVNTTSGFSNTVVSYEALTFDKTLGLFPNAATCCSITSEARGLIAYNGSSKYIENIFVKNIDTSFNSKTSENGFYWTGSAEINAIFTNSTDSLKKNGESVLFSVSLVPSQEWFELSSLSWSISDKHCSPAQVKSEPKVSLTTNGLNATFTVIDFGDQEIPIFGGKYKWTYTISASITAKSEYGGQKFSSTFKIVAKQ